MLGARAIFVIVRWRDDKLRRRRCHRDGMERDLADTTSSVTVRAVGRITSIAGLILFAPECGEQLLRLHSREANVAQVRSIELAQRCAVNSLRDEAFGSRLRVECGPGRQHLKHPRGDI